MSPDGPDPQSLKSWQDAFQYPIPTVRRVEQELRRDIASNKEKLRALVGTRYRELVGTAEKIVSMNRGMEEVDSTLADIGRRCNPRLMEKAYTHVQAVASCKDSPERSLTGQLALLHRSAISISRLLRRRGPLLLVAKLMVISRLLHKTFSQQPAVPPFVENLRNQLASLRRTLLRRVDKRLAPAKATPDEIIEALAAYCLATSSSSDDAIRYFHQIRLDAIGSQLEVNDPTGENILNSLRLYIRTLQTSKILLSRRLSDVLNKLKARPLLTDPEVRGLEDLDLGVLGRWVTPEVSNFTPWIKLSELSKAEIENIIKKWSKPAFEKYVQGSRVALTKWSDFSELLTLRAKVLELWLSSRSSTPAHSSLQVLKGIRSVLNERLMGILVDQAQDLDKFGQSVASTIASWSDQTHSHSQSLWDESLISIDYSNGSSHFKQAVVNRLLGRDGDILVSLRQYQAWLQAVDKSKRSIDVLRQVRWSDVLDEGEDEDLEVGIPAILTDDDPRLLREALEAAIKKAFEALDNSFNETFKALQNPSLSEKAAFMLKLIRLIQREVPVESMPANYAFANGVVPQLQLILSTKISAHTRPWKPPAYSVGTDRGVPGRSLWEGDPAIPVQPSPSAFKYLRRLTKSMSHYGPGLWDASTVQCLKRTLQKEFVKIAASTMQQMKSSFTAPQEAKDNLPEVNDSEPPTQNGDDDSPPNPETETENTDPYKSLQDHMVQLYFDTSYFKNAFEVGDSETSHLAEVLGTIRGELEDQSQATMRIDQAAREHWKRTHLLFGLLTDAIEP
ncbi:uncharacterized protein BP01DRAFT_334762 [Aspergillus saccharolyticus JOP 1030-1]|uniref:Conserved oligomeric Golgi complex subunit 1 n=1 Tax=Aspergillus saccharolyticus JOP 1030-1 TaxID=1450539 RepID=A0A319ANX5_9EURO|nr:hypothetical protein BP01DRAFT_334762 [Aspergillus saccharolyticus JOP 1030-1]PYH48192.1 hypothetical protein BP01DRAFT_334762 [Aspergillus saccharolyticus JOP 1030-1]